MQTIFTYILHIDNNYNGKEYEGQRSKSLFVQVESMKQFTYISTAYHGYYYIEV